MLIKRFTYFLLLAGMIFALNGCSSNVANTDSSTSAATDSSAMMSLTDDHQAAALDKIQRDGVEVKQLGDSIILILPSALYFQPGTPLINKSYYPVLNDIAKYLRRMNKVSIKVAGYTDNMGSPTRNLAMSRQQALEIANYLWNCGVDTRVLYSVGYGDKKPLTANTSTSNRNLNRRVEITLRKIVDNEEI